MPDDAVIKLGYDNAKVRTGAKETERIMKNSADHIRTSWDRALSSIRSKVGGIGQGIAQGIGQQLTQGLVAAANQAAKEFTGLDLGGMVNSGINANLILDDLLDRANRLNTSAESLQRLEIFGKVNGMSPDEMAASMQRVNRSLAELGDNDAAREAFAALGLDAAEFAKLEPDQQLIQLAAAFQQAQREGKGLAEIYDLAGKSGGNLLHILRTPIEELQKLAKQPVIPEATVLRASQIADEMTLAVEANNKMIMQQRTGLQLTKEQAAELEKEAAARKAGQAAARGAAALQAGVAQDQADEPKEKDLRAARERKAAAADLMGELRILEAKAAGNERLTKELEKQERIRKQAAEIEDQLGLGSADARGIAEKFEALNEKAARREEDGEPSAFDGRRRKIRTGKGTGGLMRGVLSGRTGETFNEFFHHEQVKSGLLPRESPKSFKEFFEQKTPRGNTRAPNAGNERNRDRTGSDANRLLERIAQGVENLNAV